MVNKVYSMDDEFLVSNVRKRLIDGLKKLGYSQKIIDELIKICDNAYKEFGIPYPAIEEVIKKDSK